jgi:mannitol 2-dehydrogenase
MGDTIPRLAQDGSNRQPKFILPSLRDRLRSGGGIEGLSLETALWCRHCAAVTESGAPVDLDDPNADRLISAARAAKDDPAAFLGLRDMFGDLSDAPQFRAPFAAALTRLWRDGARATLRHYLSGQAL